MKAMIISVGGTPEPVVVSLLEHRPDYICFFASQQSVDKIGEIKERVKAGGHQLADYKVICDDVNDLVHCYEKALQCTTKLADKGVDPGDVVVDYTAGTKTMTAALTLATIGHGYGFSYVGGKKRTKNGLGVVITGTEVVRDGISPWQIFAVEEKKRLTLFISSFQYEAAIKTMRETMSNLGPGEKEVWAGISKILEGYLAWDNFDHQKALKYFRGGLERLSLCEKFGLGNSEKDYINHVKHNFNDLIELNNKTKCFTEMHPVLIRDLVSNAKRRYLQNKYDDGVARLYRALEMAGQIEFENAIGCPTSDVDPQKLPASIREEYVKRYRSEDDLKLKIPLYATFRALKEMDNPMGRTFFENKDTFKKILSARNSSIFAHGTQAVGQKTFEKFSKIIQDLFVKGPLIDFPSLHW